MLNWLCLKMMTPNSRAPDQMGKMFLNFLPREGIEIYEDVFDSSSSTDFKGSWSRNSIMSIIKSFIFFFERRESSQKINYFTVLAVQVETVWQVNQFLFNCPEDFCDQRNPLRQQYPFEGFKSFPRTKRFNLLYVSGREGGPRVLSLNWKCSLQRQIHTQSMIILNPFIV